ncbi:glycoside hydrolase family 127 protein [soil metagenome]
MRTAVLPRVGVGRLRPVDAAGVHVTDGFWADRLATNREKTIPHGLEQLEASGALGNFRNAARGSGLYVGGLDDVGITFPFLDSDVYKWLEAVGWEMGGAEEPTLLARAGNVIELVRAAQQEDGYLGTFVSLSGREPYSDLAWGHELYCIGHLIQAAIAWQRSLGDGRLSAIARRAIDHIEGQLGEGRREGIDGHPEIEMALVELYRMTGEERYLRLAKLFIDRRGRGLLGAGRLGARYWQDHAPVREAPTVAGHAVRQLYLECGVVDLALETDDAELLSAVIRRWEDMWATRTYLTGGLGSRHRDEAFGDPFELPSDRAYTETCAAIASVMLAWRLFLATGESRFADAIERTLFNAVLPGVSLEGTRFFYTNPLHRRERPGTPGGRAPWYPCACCPPNVMRTLSSLPQMVVTGDDAGLWLAQYADATVETSLEGAPVSLSVATDYPWDGRVEVAVGRGPEHPWTLRLRMPDWARGATVHAGETRRAVERGAGWIDLTRAWQPGDRVVLELEMPPRLTVPDERIDAVRGCLAIERGPIVYCLEQLDLPEGHRMEDIELFTTAESLEIAAGPPDLGGVREIHGLGWSRATKPAPRWPYLDLTSVEEEPAPRSTRLKAIPYLAWANRRPGAMRVWLPARGAEHAASIGRAQTRGSPREVRTG